MWTVHWRLTDYRTHPGVKQFEDLGKRPPFWFGPLAIDGIPTATVRNSAVDGTPEEFADMAIRGRAISAAADEERGECESIVLERHKALGWVCGLTALYSDVPLDT